MSGARVKFNPEGLKIRGVRGSEDLSVAFTPTPRSYPREAVKVSCRDLEAEETVAAYTAEFEPTVTVTGYLEGLKLELQGSSAQTFAFEGSHIRKVGAGIPSVSLRVSNRLVSRDYIYNITGGATPDKAENTTWSKVTFLPGTLAHEATLNVLALLPPEGPSAQRNCQFLDGGQFDVGYISAQDNPDFYLKDFDWSFTTAARTGLGWALPFVLVSPRHVIWAYHVEEIPLGKQLTFRRPDGSHQTASIEAYERIPELPNAAGDSRDLAIGYLSAPITGISFPKLLPPDYADYFAAEDEFGTPYGRRLTFLAVPGIARNANTGTGAVDPTGTGRVNIAWNSPKFLACEIGRFSSETDNHAAYVSGNGVHPLVHAHSRSAYGGDSGSPYFWFIRERGSEKPTPTLVTLLFTTGTGMHLGYWFNWLEEKMGALALSKGDDAAYSLLRTDLTGYTRFPRVTAP